MFDRFKKTDLNRRTALQSMGTYSLGAAGLLAAASHAGNPAFAGAHATGESADGLNLDFSKPEDNLTAWVKLISSLEDGKETCGFFQGTQYAVVGTQEVIKPLFRIAGFGMSRVTKLPDGRYQNLHKEVVYYLDPKEDKIIEQWDNPYTGEKVDVFFTHNDPVNSHYAPMFEQKFGTEETGIETVKFPFILPWQVFGDRVVVSFEVNTRWPTPLDPAVWKREHFGEWYRTSEYFQIHASMKDLNDPNKDKAHHTGAWQKIAPWHPWMLMDNQPGGIFGWTNVFSLNGTDELPQFVREYTEANFPDYMNAPTEWVEPNMTTWETFAKERTPAPPKAVE